MNGREAINLTTEANLICQTDYLHNTIDKCPRPIKKQIALTCCGSNTSNNFI